MMKTPMMPLLLRLSLSPLAESFLVLMILAAYSWPVQSLTQRRTTEKAPLGNRDRTERRRQVSCCISRVSLVSITLTCILIGRWTTAQSYHMCLRDRCKHTTGIKWSLCGDQQGSNIRPPSFPPTWTWSKPLPAVTWTLPWHTHTPTQSSVAAHHAAEEGREHYIRACMTHRVSGVQSPFYNRTNRKQRIIYRLHCDICLRFIISWHRTNNNTINVWSTIIRRKGWIDVLID